ncbi:MAG: hypothetical protein V4726_18865 [Verrucomicrobiota bacterium]
MNDETETPAVPPVKDALTYPLRGSGKLILIIGAVLWVLISLVSWFSMLSLPATLIGLAYFNAYYFNIVESTVAGKDGVPDWPDISDFMEGIVLPFARMLAVWGLSFLPYMVMLALTYDGESPWGKPLVWAALAWAVFYFPMAILNVIISNEMAKGLPRHVLPRIRRNFPPYLVLVLLLAAALVVSSVLGSLVSGIPFAGGLLSAGTGLYFMMAQARGAGLFYLKHLEDEDGDGEPGIVPALEDQTEK